jgi:hypothetical protein
MSDPFEADVFALLNDQPVEKPVGNDALGTAAAVSSLASLIMGSRESAPFTVGIDAGWGMGKSSMMLQLQAALHAQEQQGVVTSWFNAWTAQGNDALAGLIKSALMSVDENVLRRTLRRVARHRGLLTGLRVLLILVASFFRLARVIDQLWDVLSVDASSRNAIRQDLREAFESWSKKTKRTQAGRLLVVFIDDLDRCSSEVIVAICEAMRLYLALPGIVFVIGCDQDILAQAAQSSGFISSAAGYLEKIIQIAYKLAHGEDQMSRLLQHYAEESGTTELFGESVQRIAIQGIKRNPRRLKRLINSFIVEYRLTPEWARLRGAEALIDAILLQSFYRDFYNLGAAGQDVVNEFLEYKELRLRFKKRGELNDSDRKFFRNHYVKEPMVGEDNAEALSRLEQKLPPCFPALVKQEEFAQIVSHLHRVSHVPKSCQPPVASW